jgi:peptide/nickel transport system substrate-binding protein
VSSPRSTRQRPSRLAAGAFVLLGLVGLTACSGSTAKNVDATVAPTTPVVSGPVSGGTLDIAVPATTIRWSPSEGSWTTVEEQASRAVYDRLMSHDANGLPVPELLETISANSTFSVWTLKVRPGVSFHDGTPLDASAIAFNLEAQRTAASSRDLLTPIASITAPDTATVVVTMYTPWSTFPEVLTGRVGTIAAPATVAGLTSGPVGTGPFVWAGSDASGTITFTKNPTYWKKGLPHLDSVRLVPIPEAADRVTALVDGRVGMVSVDEPRQLTRLESLPSRESKVTLYEDRNAEKPKVDISLDTGRPPFDRISARRAITLATDRTEILSKAFDDQGSIARGMVSDTSPWYADHGNPARDIDKAKKQVEEYTKETGQPLTFHLLVPPDTTIARVASLWRLELAAAGIDVVIDPVDQDAIGFAELVGQFQSALQVGFDSPHPDAYEPLFRGIPAEQAAVSTNITRYINPLVTKAFADARSTNDVTRQVDDYRIVQEQVSVDTPYLFLVQVRQLVAAAPKFRDVTQWSTGSGGAALGLDAATVSLAQIWIAN